MVSLNITTKRTGYCKKCSNRTNRDYFLEHRLLPIWYKDDIPQFKVPNCLKRLTHAEKMIIQRISPVVPLHHIKHGVFGLSGHVCAFEQRIDKMVDILPRLPTDATVLRVFQEIKAEIGSNRSNIKEFRIRKSVVLEALRFLKIYNHEYMDITIDESRLDWIDGEVGDLDTFSMTCPVIQTNKDDNNANADLGPAKSQCVEPRQDHPDIEAFGSVDEGGLAEMSPGDVLINSELQASLKAAKVNASVCMDWPAISKTPVNEFSETRIFARAFPWLFPGGFGDLKDFPQHEKKMKEWAKQLLLYEDGRFAQDKIFCFYALNYIIRHRNSSDGKFFIDDFQKNVPTTLEELKEEIQNGNTEFINHLTYYNKRIKGSNPYWLQKRSELYSWINNHVQLGNGPPMFFITLSCAEYFWPDVISLLKDRLQIAGLDDSDCYPGSPKLIQLVNDYTIVIQEYFQERTIRWLETVGKKLFGIKHYWIRFEFAPARGQIHAHLLAIPDNFNIYKLCHHDLKQDNGEEKRTKRLAEWAEAKFGLTACVGTDFDQRTINNEIPPVSFRFVDLNDDDNSIYEDGQDLLKFCQVHECSNFCMKKGNEKK
jgi:hypothetical protein